MKPSLFSMVLAATAKPLLLLFTLWGNQIQGWSPGLRRSCTVNERRTQLGLAITVHQDGSHQEKLSSSSSSAQFKVKIRESLHGDLGKCADVVMSAFYPDYKSPFRHMVRLAELSRLQQSFSYDRSEHVMYVALVDNMIVGFCDIDLRPPNRPMPYSHNPRPYLSDLCVHADYRRKGIGRDLVSRCEEFCLGAGKDDVYIRVEANNTAAMDLYTRLGYFAIDNPDCFDGSIRLLVKRLRYSQELMGGTMEDGKDRSIDFSV